MRVFRVLFFSITLVGLATLLFGAGYSLGRSRGPEVDRYLVSALQSVGLEGYTGLVRPPGTSAEGVPLSEEAREQFKVFWEAWSWIDREFYDRSKIDPQNMTYGALRGMLGTLGDPHTAFLDPEHQRLSEAELQGSFDGIGVQVDLKDGQLRVVAPLEGLPGDRAGLKPGDVITHVNEQGVEGLSLTEAVLRIRGPKGTTVRLQVQRAGTPEPLTFDIVRDEIKLPSVRSEMRKDQIAYVRLSGFSETTTADMSRALQELQKQDPHGLILDLRNNPGGYLHIAVDVTSQFLREGVVLYQQHGTGYRQAFQVKPGGVATTIPMTVLVNKGSASASEIVAGALQAHNRAVLVGEPTYGKGTVQKIHPLSDGSSVRITFARWLTPIGQPLEGRGLQPNVAVPSPQNGDADRQLEAAEQYLLEQTSSERAAA